MRSKQYNQQVSVGHPARVRSRHLTKPRFLPPAVALLVAAIVGTSALSSYAVSVFYDVANAPLNSRQLSAHYVDNANNVLVASDLTASATLRFPGDSDLGTGNFIFDGWPSPGRSSLIPNYYIDFSVTALQAFTARSLSYTFFAGVWSGRAGPTCMYVAASKDGFTTATSLKEHYPILTTPFVANCPNDYVEDLSVMGMINPGQTLSVRFYAFWSNYEDIPGGLWNKSSSDYNPTLEVTPVYVPPANVPDSGGTVSLAGLSLLALTFSRVAFKRA